MIRRVLAILALVTAMSAQSAMAQASKDPIADAMPQEAGIDENGGGNPLYGYLAFGFLAGVTLFAVCKTSRRSFAT